MSTKVRINISAAGAKALGNYSHDNYSHGFYAYATDMEIAYNYVEFRLLRRPFELRIRIQLFVVDPGQPSPTRVYRNFVTRSNRRASSANTATAPTFTKISSATTTNAGSSSGMELETRFGTTFFP